MAHGGKRLFGFDGDRCDSVSNGSHGSCSGGGGDGAKTLMMMVIHTIRYQPLQDKQPQQQQRQP